jgi:hypothetical protein
LSARNNEQHCNSHECSGDRQPAGKYSQNIERMNMAIPAAQHIA